MRTVLHFISLQFVPCDSRANVRVSVNVSKMTLSACEPQRELVWGQAAAAKPKMWSSNKKDMVRSKRAAEMQGQG